MQKYDKKIIWDVARREATAYLDGEPVLVAYSFADAEAALDELISELEAMEQAEERAARFVREELTDFRPERVVSIRGDIAVSRANAELLEPAHA